MSHFGSWFTVVPSASISSVGFFENSPTTLYILYLLEAAMETVGVNTFPELYR